MVKEQAKQIVDRLPEDATWDDLMYELYLEARQGAAATATTERFPPLRPRSSAAVKQKDRRP